MLAQPTAERLAKLLPLLTSDRDGEVLAAVAAIRRTLDAAGLTVHDLAAAIGAPASPTGGTSDDAIMVVALRRAAGLSDWERRFIESLATWLQQGRRLTPKQRATLHKIHARECPT